MIGGKWLKLWIEAGAVLSAIGLYEAQLSSNTFQLLGMAELGLLPRSLSTRSKWFNTPWLSILVSTLITLSISFLSFSDIISAANFLYNLGMLIEFAAFIRLRMKMPELNRPYKVPLGTAGVIVMCAVPSVILVFLMVVSSWRVFLITAALTFIALALYYCMAFCRSRGCFDFSTESEVNQLEDEKKGGRTKKEIRRSKETIEENKKRKLFEDIKAPPRPSIQRHRRCPRPPPALPRPSSARQAGDLCAGAECGAGVGRRRRRQPSAEGCWQQASAVRPAASCRRPALALRSLLRASSLIRPGTPGCCPAEFLRYRHRPEPLIAARCRLPASLRLVQRLRPRLISFCPALICPFAASRHTDRFAAKMLFCYVAVLQN
ncbi:hypothetical protein J5N97_014082 [Dioscorea zingiberensis]|uniref:Uncharacterized protein n=1 Tax=Dioscorea zingiberensis TaxID=325984 RepID=A0A9D5CUF7_9LILI|nr:hypothetical protein J5N97_014082 [Dioscorea zingiberensis]